MEVIIVLLIICGFAAISVAVTVGHALRSQIRQNEQLRSLCLKQESTIDGLLNRIECEMQDNKYLEEPCRKLIEYRDRNTLNFQLEKADDFINQMRVALEPPEAEEDHAV